MVQYPQQVEQPVIISNNDTAAPTTTLKWITINHIHLYQSDKDALLGNGWLNDQYILIAQTLIKQQHPRIHGLLPTLMQGRNPLPTGALQILHVDSNHWVTVSTFDTEAQDIIVYDPKNYSLSSSTQTILAKLVNTDKPSFTVRMESVSQDVQIVYCLLLLM